MKTHAQTSSPAAIWERVVRFEEKLSPLAARALLKIRFSQRDRKQMNALAASARAGTLTPQHRLDLDTYERLGCVLDILHSMARMALKPRRAVSR